MLPNQNHRTPKVLVVHNILWSHYKGAVFSELHNLLSLNGLELRVLHVAPAGISQQNLGSIDYSIHRYPYTVLFEEDLEEISLVRKVSRLTAEIWKSRAEAVIVPGYDLLALASIMAARLLGARILMAVDSTAMDHRQTVFKEGYKRLVVQTCDAFLCFGSRSKDYLLRLGADERMVFSGCQAADNAFIEKACLSARADAERIRSRLGLPGRNFIFVGRLTGVKNVETLIRAFATLRRRSERAREWGLLIVGDGGEGPHLKRLAAELDCSDVVFLGGMNWGAIPSMLAVSDVLVLPSLSEPWGMVVNEAMACGLPVIVSSRCGSAYDLVREGENGFVFDPRDSDALAAAMLKFVCGEADAPSMGRCSKQIIDRFTPHAAAERMLSGILSVVQTHGCSRGAA